MLVWGFAVGLATATPDGTEPASERRGHRRDLGCSAAAQARAWQEPMAAKRGGAKSQGPTRWAGGATFRPALRGAGAGRVEAWREARSRHGVQRPSARGPDPAG